MRGPHVSLPDLNPQQLEAVIQKAMQDRNYPVAEQACIKLSDLQPNSPMPRWILAQIHGVLGNHKHQIKLLTTCVSLSPKQTEFRFALARAYRADGDM